MLTPMSSSVDSRSSLVSNRLAVYRAVYGRAMSVPRGSQLRSPASNSPASVEPDAGPHVEPTAKRIRAVLGGQVIVDTTAALLVWEIPYYPQYYLPVADVVEGALTPTDTVSHSDVLGDAVHLTIKGGGVEAVDGARRYPQAASEPVRSTVRFDWNAVDAWFEEDAEVFVHPRSPYTRVDVLDSSRTVRIEIDGVVVAESNRPKLLFETGLQTRYYLPKTDVRLDLLTPTDSSTACPYKGTARYWSVDIDGTVHDDVVWGYDAPLAESLPVAGLMCFYNERVDVYVDDELQ